jgi:L-alanine-DL-glutamate epimerase-like enolase superfamily enzyme
VIHLRVVEAVQQVNRARTGRRQADADLPGELRVRARHEGRHLFMADLNELHVLDGPKRADDAENAVAWVAVDPLDAPRPEPPQDELAHFLRHWPPPPIANLIAGRTDCQERADNVRRRACRPRVPRQLDRMGQRDRHGRGPAIDAIDAAAYVIPTDAPESDGTLEWDRTTLVVVQIAAGGVHGLGYTYASGAAVAVVRETLAKRVLGADVFAIPSIHGAMLDGIRNLGRPGIVASAISAVDTALWDTKSRLLEVPLFALLGAMRSGVPAYGSGGFTSYSISRLQEQLGGWAERGLKLVKMKVGRDAGEDPARVHAARRAIGARAHLFVDANGAYSRKQALALADRFASDDVRWFEEPVSSDDLEGLRLIRDRAPAGMDVAAGEYGYEPFYFRRMLDAGAVDVLQADATRCGGISGFIAAHALCDAHGLPLSAHCAPALHVHLGCALNRVRHVEYFHDHQRIEHMLFDGAVVPRDGLLSPDRTRPGLGLDFKAADATRFAIG